MSDEIGEAEREVEAARRRVVENINELRGGAWRQIAIAGANG